MDNIAIELANYLVECLVNGLARIPPNERLIVGIAGVPASGKTTLAKVLCGYINESLRRQSSLVTEDVATVVGLDGWHLTRAQLDAFPDAKLAHDRRGAHWTFDGESFVAFVKKLRVPLDGPVSASDVVYAPSFSHELKDPTPEAVSVHPHNRIVIIEGLYTFLSLEPWVEAGRLLDERWWVDLSEEEARQRLVARHVLTGVAKDVEEAEWRSRENDAPNGRFIKQNILEPTRMIYSVEDPALKQFWRQSDEVPE